MGKIVVIGASPNPTRFSYKAVKALLRRNFEVIAIGNREGTIGDLSITTHLDAIEDAEKIILYVNAAKQQSYYNYILQLQPEEIVFNPGTENSELAQLAIENGIEIRYDCALVLLDSGLL